jgi:hypothetical protein
LQWQLQFLKGHDGDEHNAHQNIITNTYKRRRFLLYALNDSKK